MVKTGELYRHFKGNAYVVVGVGSDSETLDRVVTYKALYGDGLLWTRPYTAFNETMTNGIKRFALIDDVSTLTRNEILALNNHLIENAKTSVQQWQVFVNKLAEIGDVINAN